MEQYPVWLEHYGYVWNIDSSMWLTVRGGVYPSPIIPSSSSFEPWWRFYVCVCVCMRVEKAARRAECQLLAHVVNIRNQTGANRMQVRLAIAFTCTVTLACVQQQAGGSEGWLQMAEREH